MMTPPPPSSSADEKLAVRLRDWSHTTTHEFISVQELCDEGAAWLRQLANHDTTARAAPPRWGDAAAAIERLPRRNDRHVAATQDLGKAIEELQAQRDEAVRARDAACAEIRERCAKVADDEEEPTLEQLWALWPQLTPRDAESMQALCAGAVRATKQVIAAAIRSLSLSHPRDEKTRDRQ